MDIKELKEELSGLKNDLTGKTQEQIKSAMADMEVKFQKAIEEKMEGGVKAEDLAKFEEKYNEGVKSLQDHLDKLDVKMQSRKEAEIAGKGFEGRMQEFIKSNGEKISKFRKGLAFDSMELKVVGNMTTGNLTGDEERAYSREVAAVPGRLVHFVDLCGPDINIGVGTYTFPRETGSEGAIATQTEGADKGQIDYDFTNVDVTTDFIAGFAVYSKKMRNNLPFLESFLPQALRRDYMNAEDGVFNTALAAAATASSEIITGQNKVEMIISELAALEGSNFGANGIVMRPADWYDILVTEKSSGAGYGLPGLVSFENGVLRVNGIPVFKANWLAANKYYVGDWSYLNRVVTEGLSLEFSEHDEDNFRKNNITARIEAQVGLAIHRTDSVIYGDFTAT